LLRPPVTAGRPSTGSTALAIVTLKRRSEFLRVRGGRRWAGPAFVVEAKPRQDDAEAPVSPRFGFTVTRQCGTAVVRNRIRRRLRAAVSGLAAEHAKPGYDYVVIARTAAFDRPFPALKADLAAAFERINKAADPRRKA
jgi:ribonuclease P protein component